MGGRDKRAATAEERQLRAGAVPALERAEKWSHAEALAKKHVKVRNLILEMHI